MLRSKHRAWRERRKTALFRTLLAGGLVLAVISVAHAREGAEKIDAPWYMAQVPGTYVVTKNLQATESPAIYIASSDVTIDLNGFTLSGSTGMTHSLIISDASFERATIKNGFLRDCPLAAIRALGSDVVLRDLTITGCGVAAELGLGAVIEHCIIGGNRLATNNAALLDLGRGGRVQNSVFYGNVFVEDGTLIRTERSALLTRNVIVGNTPVDSTNTTYITLIDGRGDLAESVISDNEGGLRVRGVVGMDDIRRTVFCNNDAQRDVYGFYSNQFVELCVAYDNDNTKSFGNWVYPFHLIDLAVHCLSAEHYMDTAGGADASGFSQVNEARGCVAYANEGFGFLDASVTYCVAVDDYSGGFSPNSRRLVENCLAAANGGAGIYEPGTTPAELDVIDCHFSTNGYPGVDMMRSGCTYLRNSANQPTNWLSGARYGTLIVPTAGSPINTDNPFANFRW